MPTTTSITKLKQDSYSTFASSTMKSLSMSNGSHTRLLPDIRIYRNGPGAGKYSRATSIGYLNHDLTLLRNPAFSIGKAKRSTKIGGDYPAPNVYDSASAYPYSSKSSKSPGYYLCGRSTDNFNDSRSYARKIDGPAPGSYAPERNCNSYKRRVPSYSIGRAVRFPEINF